ncbi:hypothetical protein ACFCZ1_32435, partial [Streptomyces sp. NPDC056224]|uniref:hypothetical protein n=1 Tax=Streptomyces sp. NPDC056224 TaxID=3345750 RepID=UPI0035E24E28
TDPDEAATLLAEAFVGDVPGIEVRRAATALPLGVRALPRTCVSAGRPACPAACRPRAGCAGVSYAMCSFSRSRW